MNLFELCTILFVLMMLSIVDEGASESGKITIHYIGKVAKILRSDKYNDRNSCNSRYVLNYPIMARYRLS